jgi:trk system potassium uptake protein
MAAEVARKLFDVEHVVARLYNPMRERTYQQLGLDYVCGTTLVAEVLLDKIRQVTGTTSQPFGDVEIVQFKASQAVEGKRVGEIEIARRFRIAAVSRGDEMFVPEPDAVLHAGDIVMASVKEEAFGKVERYMEE